jgi:hypothetical protein
LEVITPEFIAQCPDGVVDDFSARDEVVSTVGRPHSPRHSQQVFAQSLDRLAFVDGRNVGLLTREKFQGLPKLGRDQLIAKTRRQRP